MIAADGSADMTELVNQSALLCRNQQQQETQCFDHLSHPVSTLTEYRTSAQSVAYALPRSHGRGQWGSTNRTIVLK
jgi:hypothetical protein